MGFYAGSIGTRRFHILAMYAVSTAPNALLRCLPAGGKIVFATKEKAEECERLLAQLTEATPKRVYRCDRVTHLHWHLTSRLREGKP